MKFKLFEGTLRKAVKKIKSLKKETKVKMLNRFAKDPETKRFWLILKEYDKLEKKLEQEPEFLFQMLLDRNNIYPRVFNTRIRAILEMSEDRLAKIEFDEELNPKGGI